MSPVSSPRQLALTRWAFAAFGDSRFRPGRPIVHVIMSRRLFRSSLLVRVRRDPKKHRFKKSTATLWPGSPNWGVGGTPHAPEQPPCLWRAQRAQRARKFFRVRRAPLAHRLAYTHTSFLTTAHVKVPNEGIGISGNMLVSTDAADGCVLMGVGSRRRLGGRS